MCTAFHQPPNLIVLIVCQQHLPCLRECLEVLVERLSFLQRGGDSATTPTLAENTAIAHSYRLSADNIATGYPSGGDSHSTSLARHSFSVLPRGMYVNLQDVAVKLAVRAGAAFTPSGVLVRFANNASVQHSRHQVLGQPKLLDISWLLT